MFRRTLLTIFPGGAFLTMLSCSVVLGCSGDGLPGPSDPQDPQNPPEPPAPVSAATIAYARGGEIRLIEPDGSNDHTLWTVPRPDLSYTVTGLSWRPDATEIAFGSDHEQATSFYERDIYALGSNGLRLRKLTNGPTLEQLASFGKGTVTLRVQNNTADGGPWFVYVAGAPEPQQTLIAPGESRQLTFTGVADFGDIAQPAVVINGINRWFGDAVVDVQAGRSADAGLLIVSPLGGVPHLGADAPTWSSDGTRVAFFRMPICQVNRVDASPAPGLTAEPLLVPEVFESPCSFDWGPTSAANQILVADDGDFSASGETHIYRYTEGSSSRGAPAATLGDYVRIADLRWLPDGSGFIVARTGGLFDENINLFEYSFAGSVRQLTTFSGEYVRRFSISPDGRRIAFERVTSLDGPSDLWVVGRDGSDAHLIVRNGAYPAWNPQKP